MKRQVDKASLLASKNIPKKYKNIRFRLWKMIRKILKLKEQFLTD